MPTLTPEQQAKFNEASEHPYECRCDVCKLWWANVPPEVDHDEGDDLSDEPAF